MALRDVLDPALPSRTFLASRLHFAPTVDFNLPTGVANVLEVVGLRDFLNPLGDIIATGCLHGDCFGSAERDDVYEAKEVLADARVRIPLFRDRHGVASLTE